MILLNVMELVEHLKLILTQMKPYRQLIMYD
jgi:hypothetical protein